MHGPPQVGAIYIFLADVLYLFGISTSWTVTYLVTLHLSGQLQLRAAAWPRLHSFSPLPSSSFTALWTWV